MGSTCALSSNRHRVESGRLTGTPRPIFFLTPAAETAKTSSRMKSKSLIPWLVALVLLVAAAFLYSKNSAKDVELAKLRAESQQLPALRTELDQLKTTGTPAQAEEIARLQKDNQDLLRLRNEIGQMRKEKQELAKQLQSAQAVRAGAQEAAALLQQAQSENQQLRAAAQAAQAAAVVDATQLLNACVNNLRQIDGAKQQWALENKKGESAFPTTKDLAPYFKNGVLPACPAGGKYTLNAINAAPTCSVVGHALPQ